MKHIMVDLPEPMMPSMIANRWAGSSALPEFIGLAIFSVSAW
jgi:hypothetical protein